MSLNLFQKYAPKSFNEIIGQDNTVQALIKRSENNNFPQCIYLTGYTGTGKTVISRIIAKSILCENKINGHCCNECKICNAINNETRLLNYSEENASNCGIDKMREIEENASRKIGFTKNEYKVFYIDELQEMATKNKASVKNLLKLLEKPSKYNYFILGSMNDSVIPSAVKNRCVTYYLNLIDEDSMFERLHYICEQEGIIINKEDSDKIDVLLSITENSEGSLRTAISLLERVIDSDLWTPDKVLKELNLMTSDNVIQIINSLISGDISILNYSHYKSEVVDKIKSKFILLYRVFLGGYIDKKQSDELKKINKIEIQKVEKIIDILNELLKYIYLTPQLIEFYFLKIVMENRKQLRERR